MSKSPQPIGELMKGAQFWALRPYFTASLANVFATIQDPTRLARWWGPNGFTNTFDLFEFKPDGKWVFAMIGRDGKAYPNESVFGTIEQDRQVTIHHVLPV